MPGGLSAYGSFSEKWNRDNPGILTAWTPNGMGDKFLYTYTKERGFGVGHPGF